MYIIKELSYNNLLKHHVINDGISCAISANQDNKLICFDYFGEIEATIGDFADKTKFGKSKYSGEVRVTYASEMFVKEIRDNFKKIFFNISTYQPEKLEGYIIFIKKSSIDIKTNGEKIFGRFPNEIVAILKEGNYLTFDGGTLKVINNELMLVI